MFFFVIFGTRGVTSTLERGQFYCPTCAGQRRYRHCKVRRFFTLYFIPVIPLDEVGRYVECQACNGTFKEEVLDYSPQRSAEDFEAVYAQTIKKSMVMMMLADGDIVEHEREMITGIYRELTGHSLTEEELDQEIREVNNRPQELPQYLAEVTPYLNENGKEMIVKSAFLVSMADGEFDDAEADLMGQLSSALELSEAHIKGILQEFKEL